MSRVIDFEKPLSDEDKQWLHAWSQDWRIEENERKFGKAEEHADGRPVDVTQVLADAGVEVPEPQAQPVVQLTGGRDHPLTGVVDDGGEEDAVDIDELNVDELKQHLHDLGQPTTGNKKELQERLAKALED